jgi:hypothetical protein
MKEVEKETLEHLYVVNKQAKRQHGVDKTILYRMKDEILKQISDKRQSVEIHEKPKIDGEPSYAIRFEDETGQCWTFHTPQETLDIPHNDAVEKKSLDDFNKSGEYEITGQRESLKKALKYFQREFGVNANNLHPKMPDTRRTWKKYLCVDTCPHCGLQGTQQEIKHHIRDTHDQESVSE